MRQQFRVRPIEARTKGELKQLRRDGFIPVSIQHRGQDTEHYQEEAKPLEEYIRHHGKASILELVVEPGNKQQTVMVHDVQRDPLTHQLLQVTFQRVARNEPIKVQVPLVFHGEPELVRQHTAMVQHPVETVEVRCLPDNLPEHITVEIGQLTLGEVLRVSDLPATDRYEILTPPDTVLVSLSSLQAQLAEEAAEVAKAAEEKAAESAAEATEAETA
jgi:large subunit ribosomal protein L25